MISGSRASRGSSLLSNRNASCGSKQRRPLIRDHAGESFPNHRRQHHDDVSLRQITASAAPAAHFAGVDYHPHRWLLEHDQHGVVLRLGQSGRHPTDWPHQRRKSAGVRCDSHALLRGSGPRPAQRGHCNRNDDLGPRRLRQLFVYPSCRWRNQLRHDQHLLLPGFIGAQRLTLHLCRGPRRQHRQRRQLQCEQ